MIVMGVWCFLLLYIGEESRDQSVWDYVVTHHVLADTFNCLQMLRYLIHFHYTNAHTDTPLNFLPTRGQAVSVYQIFLRIHLQENGKREANYQV